MRGRNNTSTTCSLLAQSPLECNSNWIWKIPDWQRSTLEGVSGWCVETAFSRWSLQVFSNLSLILWPQELFSLGQGEDKPEDWKIRQWKKLTQAFKVLVKTCSASFPWCSIYWSAETKPGSVPRSLALTCMFHQHFKCNWTHKSYLPLWHLSWH